MPPPTRMRRIPATIGHCAAFKALKNPGVVGVGEGAASPKTIPSEDSSFGSWSSSFGSSTAVPLAIDPPVPAGIAPVVGVAWIMVMDVVSPTASDPLPASLKARTA